MNGNSSITRHRFIWAIGNSAMALFAHNQCGSCVMAAGESAVRLPVDDDLGTAGTPWWQAGGST